MPTLQIATATPPKGLAEMLQELGDGEAGFGGTPYGRGDMELEEYLDCCVKGTIPTHVPSGRVPQTIFWITEDGVAVGMLRMRHFLNDSLRIEGGHIGYYIRPSARRRGIATEALRQTLQELARLGERRALLTTDPDNLGSIRVIEANGGSLATRVPDPDGLGLVSQYWIELA